MGEEQGIGWAVEQLQGGKRIRRSGWNGKRMFIELQVPDANSKMTAPYVYMEYADNPAPGGYRIPWLCSQGDLLATDWELWIE